MRTTDGSAGDADYGTIGTSYSAYRQPEPRIGALIEQALAGARTVVNVGAGAGSYESAAIDGVAESLPFPDDAFDGAMTTFSVHQWSDGNQEPETSGMGTCGRSRS